LRETWNFILLNPQLKLVVASIESSMDNGGDARSIEIAMESARSVIQKGCTQDEADCFDEWQNMLATSVQHSKFYKTSFPEISKGVLGQVNLFLGASADQRFRMSCGAITWPPGRSLPAEHPVRPSTVPPMQKLVAGCGWPLIVRERWVTVCALSLGLGAFICDPSEWHDAVAENRFSSPGIRLSALPRCCRSKWMLLRYGCQVASM
jgi:hypothetical protein